MRRAILDNAEIPHRFMQALILDPLTDRLAIKLTSSACSFTFHLLRKALTLTHDCSQRARLMTKPMTRKTCKGFGMFRRPPRRAKLLKTAWATSSFSRTNDDLEITDAKGSRIYVRFGSGCYSYSLSDRLEGHVCGYSALP